MCNLLKLRIKNLLLIMVYKAALFMLNVKANWFVLKMTLLLCEN